MKAGINTDSFHKELDLIQEIINRMARNSFIIKGWMISLTSILFTFVVNKELSLSENIFLLIFLLVEIITFWYLDAFYLHKERCYIQLYNHLISSPNRENRVLYSLNYRPFISKVGNVRKVMWSITIVWIYIIPMLIVLGNTIFKIFT